MKTYIIFLASLLPCMAFGQSVERKVMASYGTNTVSGAGVKVSQTMGEFAVNSYTTGTLIVSEGFQQSRTTATAVEEGSDAAATFTVFPNPVGNMLNVRIESAEALNLELSMHDIQGRATTMPMRQVAVDGMTTEMIDCSQIATGTYLLSIRDVETGMLRTLQIRKVDGN